MRRIIPAVLTCAAVCVACSSIDCPVQNTVNTVYGLYKGDGTPDTLRHDTLTISTIRRDGNDTVLLNRKVGATTFELPISSGAPTDTLLVELKDSTRRMVDTLFVSKDDNPHFESVDCNMSYFHTLTGIKWTGNAIDSATITKRQVDYDASSQHIRIYFKPRG